MGYDVALSPTATKNIENAIEYYIREANKKVALNFLKDFKEVYKTLEKNTFFKFHDENYRFLPFKRYAFVAFYTLDESSKTV